MKNKILLSVLFAIISLPMFAQNNNSESIAKSLDDRCIVSIETSLGNIKIALYNDTPKHRDNFLKLVKEGFYNGILFHRVIPNFMSKIFQSLPYPILISQLMIAVPQVF